MKVKSDGEPKIIYYEDMLCDEFSDAVIEPKKIDAGYKYVETNPLKKFGGVLLYRLIAMPAARLYLKLKFSHKVYNRSLLTKCQDKGFFLYGNHTQDTGDAVMPAVLCRPRKAYVIVHANNVSMPYLGRVTPSLGALPLPDDMTAMRSFVKAIELRISQNHPVAIYPEAHIWPYYTGIRPFTDDSFQYPVKYNKPVYCFTNTYQKKGRSGVRLVTYIDGPFYPDAALPVRERRRELRDRVFDTMTKRSQNNSVELIRYIKKQTSTAE